MDKSELPPRWTKAEKAIRAVQVAFDLEMDVMKTIRMEAAINDVTPSDQMRIVLGLVVAKRPKRPRLTVSLSEADYTVLGQRYNIDPAKRFEIKERVATELTQFAHKTKHRNSNYNE